MSKKPNDPKQPRDGETSNKKEKKKPTLIPLTVLPSDNDSIDDEMSALFEEDSVKHQHGSAEPERD